MTINQLEFTFNTALPHSQKASILAQLVLLTERPDKILVAHRTMNPNSQFDPAGETEPDNTTYTLTVRCPKRPPPKYLPAFLTRTPVNHPGGRAYTIQPDETNPNLDCFQEKHLESMPTKTVKIKSAWFPADMRCAHVQNARVCEEGCYVLEKGGDIARWKCKREGCEGHVYESRVKRDEDGKVCFGKKGERMVCVEP